MLMVDIQKAFGSFRLDVSFTAEKETIGLLGASGCGKSMTLRCIAGIVKPDSGKIVLDGQTLFDSERGIDLPPQKRRVGLLFQNYALFPNMTVEQNILTGLRRSGLAQHAKRVRVAEAVERLQLGGLERRRPHQLSGGQQQRAALARILVSEPRILMLDEPFSALDSFLRWQTEREVLRVLEQFNGPALFVSHNRDEIYRLCDKVAVYDRGRIDAYCEKWALFQSPHTRAAALLTGCKNIADAYPSGENAVTVPAWNLTLRAAAPMAGDVSAVGIRAHFFRPGGTENAFACRVEQVIESPFEVRVLVRPKGASQSLCWILNKAEYAALPNRESLTLSVSPSGILPLR